MNSPHIHPLQVQYISDLRDTLIPLGLFNLLFGIIIDFRPDAFLRWTIGISLLILLIVSLYVFQKLRKDRMTGCVSPWVMEAEPLRLIRAKKILNRLKVMEYILFYALLPLINFYFCAKGGTYEEPLFLTLMLVMLAEAIVGLTVFFATGKNF